MIFSFFIHTHSLFVPTDPLYKMQFPLNNTGQFHGIAKNDISPGNFWNDGIFGGKAPVAIISDGCFYEHNDLKANFDLEHSWNYYTWEKDPKHNQTKQGTNLAAVVAAENNDICTIGVAPKTKFSCINIDNENKTRENILDSLKRGNDYFRVKLLGTVEKCKKVCRHEEFDEELNSILTNANPSVNYVAPAGADAFRGGDTNFFPLNRDPRVIVISDLTHRNAHSSWSNRGTSIMANVPVGGSSSFDSILYPSAPGLSSEKADSCNESTDPVGSGAAYVAGIVALMLEQQPRLTWRDVQYLIAITSVKNNPAHHSWVTNAADYHYSHFYGFGTISANSLSQLCKTWRSLPSQTKSSASLEADKQIPTMHHGALDIEIPLSSNIIFTEYVQIHVNVTVRDASLLRMKLTSPQGTTMFFKATSISDDSTHSITLVYTIRGFFGEKANGKWILHVVSDSIGKESMIHSVLLNAFGMTTIPSVTTTPTRNGFNPYSELTPKREATIEIGSSQISCLNDLTVNVSSAKTTKANFYISTPDKMQRWPVVDTISIPSTIDLHIPCFFKDQSELKLILEDMESGVWTDTDIKVANTKQDLIILKPERYEVIQSKFDNPNDKTYCEVNIEIVPSMQMPYWLDGSYAQRARVTLLNTDTDEVIFRHDANMRSSINIHYNGTHCPRCLLSVVPSWHHDMNDCLTMLQPVSILSLWDSEPEKWILPLNNYCPIPPGVLTPTPIPPPTASPQPTVSMTPKPTPTPESKQNKPAIIMGSAFVGAFATFLAIFMFASKRKKLAAEKPLLQSDYDYK